MKKVYVKFGEPSDDDEHIYVYEGILENNIIRLILPTLSYSACQIVAKDLEQTALLVDGKYIGQLNNGQHALGEYKIIAKLIFDKYKECFIYNEIEKEDTSIEINPQPEIFYPESTPKWAKIFLNFGFLLNTGKYGYNRSNPNQNNLKAFTKK